MRTLTSEQTRQLERELQAQRKVVLDAAREELSRGEGEAFTAIAGEVHDEGDEATAAALIDFDNEIARRHGETLRDIDAALLRIGKRRFGVCLDCGNDIGFGRLKAFPVAKRCVHCQTVRERSYAHGATPTL